MTYIPHERLQASLGYRFLDAATLELALTHSSWANEARLADSHNERLEFLGDAVLELAVSAQLFRLFPAAREGELTRSRSALVNTQSLAGIARRIDLADELKLGIGEERQGGRVRDAVLADALEAVLGAVYLDGGFMAAQKTIARLFADAWPDELLDLQARDNKTALQEACQHRWHENPRYVLEKSFGPDHARTFEVALRLPDGGQFRASGASCKKAEQAAAGLALEALGLPAQKFD